MNVETAWTRVAPDDLRRFAERVLHAAGARQDVARRVAEGLVETSVRGVDSHGIRLLPHYVAALEGGRINGEPRYAFERRAPAAGVLDADHTFGHAAGYEAMTHAMALAREAGVGWVVTRNSSHAGAAGYPALAAARRGFLAFSFLHADALLNSPGSTRAFFGTNPFCMAAPCDGEEPFCYDGGQSLVSFNRVLQLREDGASMPRGTGADETGVETSDPARVAQLLPIGDYKGFGLAMAIDVLCGLLSGMAVGRDITNMYKDPLSKPRSLGQIQVAVDIGAFQPRDLFAARMKALADAVRREPARDPGRPVMVPNDPEKRAAAERTRSGVPVKPGDLRALQQAGTRYGVVLDPDRVRMPPGSSHG